MAAYISFQPSDFFTPYLYTGTGVAIGSGGTAFTGVGFQGDLWWGKQRNGTYRHQSYDSVRGVEKYLSPSTTEVQSAADPEGLSAWSSDGFTLGDRAQSNVSAGTFVCWNWKAGTTTGLTGGTITPDAYSINTTSGFGMYKYGGNSTSGATIAHGLGAVPKMIWIKNLDIADDWQVYHVGMGNTKYLILNTTAIAGTATNRWNDTSPTSTVFSLGNTGVVNTSNDYMAYVWADVKGYSKFGGYDGIASADGPFIYCGFRPAYVLIKIWNSGDPKNWAIMDNKREGYNEDNDSLYINTSAEDTQDTIDILSNGFKLRRTDDTLNTAGLKYIYAAFAEFPIVSSNSKPGTAR